MSRRLDIAAVSIVLELSADCCDHNLLLSSVSFSLTMDGPRCEET